MKGVKEGLRGFCLVAGLEGTAGERCGVLSFGREGGRLTAFGLVLCPAHLLPQGRGRGVGLKGVLSGGGGGDAETCRKPVHFRVRRFHAVLGLPAYFLSVASPLTWGIRPSFCLECVVEPAVAHGPVSDDDVVGDPAQPFRFSPLGGGGSQVLPPTSYASLSVKATHVLHAVLTQPPCGLAVLAGQLQGLPDWGSKSGGRGLAIFRVTAVLMECADILIILECLPGCILLASVGVEPLH